MPTYPEDPVTRTFMGHVWEHPPIRPLRHCFQEGSTWISDPEQRRVKFTVAFWTTIVSDLLLGLLAAWTDPSFAVSAFNWSTEASIVDPLIVIPAAYDATVSHSIEH
jgi:hypothetical protein